MQIKDLLKYVPNFHGEHGVDSLLHSLFKNTDFSREVFSNLPGGSWTEFNIHDMKRNIYYKWDHIPRVTKSKRPDAVFQEKTPDRYSFLLIESKKRVEDLEVEIGTKLKQYLDFDSGLFSKPCWQILTKNNVWEIVDEDDSGRFWIQSIPKRNIQMFSCFAYGLKPEISLYSTGLVEKTKAKQHSILQSNPDIDLVIGVFWTEQNRVPILIYSSQSTFAKSNFGKSLENFIEQYNIHQLRNKDS